MAVYTDFLLNDGWLTVHRLMFRLTLKLILNSVELEFVHIQKVSLVELHLVPILYGTDSSRDVTH